MHAVKLDEDLPDQLKETVEPARVRRGNAGVGALAMSSRTIGLKPRAAPAALTCLLLMAVYCPALVQDANPEAPATQEGAGPVKVFILAGQSNMEGQAVADLDGKDYNEGKGTLAFLLRDPAKAPLLAHLRDAEGRWTVRLDVWVSYQIENGPRKTGPLTLGFTSYGGRHHFGPELAFGHVAGDRLPNQVLLIKTAWGGKSLYKDFRPPSSGGAVGPYYTKMLAEVRAALASLATDFPAYDGSGWELAGLVWYHGWNDVCEPKTAVPEYERNLVNLINDVRKDLGRVLPLDDPLVQ
jgi:hypothetical protein